MGIQSGPIHNLPKSFSVSSSSRSSSVDNDDLKELIRVALMRRLGVDMDMDMQRRSQSKPSRLVLPDELFVNIAKSIAAKVNKAMGFLQDLACGGNIKQFLVVDAKVYGGMDGILLAGLYFG
ncbi:Reticulon-like protein B8 [Camellia lanceoleosa]|uniref:Reticulon-like protein B8 n=1 Tax=Camellia lanceoleosa TaxID=1840588 RepID=A0ACC0J306_9ERIC|nr:Reticulon-like protein B8 [Camellia lanceoleosa]